MRLMKKVAAWILALMLLQGLGVAAGEVELPEIPVFEGTLDVRAIGTSEEAIAYAREICALDYLGLAAAGTDCEVYDWGDDVWHILIHCGEEYVELAFDKGGNLVYLDNIGSGWSAVSPALDDEAEDGVDESEEEAEKAVEWRKELDRRLEFPFLVHVNPMVFQEYLEQHPIIAGSSSEFLTHYNGTVTDTWNNVDVAFNLHYSESYRDASVRIKLGVQTAPVVRIVYFEAFCDAEEGGNG